MENDYILVLDLGGPQAVAMARKLRNQRIYTEILAHNFSRDALTRKAPRGILVAGGENGSCPFPADALTLGIPVLALGSSARALAIAQGASPEGTLFSDEVSQITFQPCPLFDGLSTSDRILRRVDSFRLPPDYQPIATTLDGLTPGFANYDKRIYALQFYAESNDPEGAQILSNFAEKICGCTPFWTIEHYFERELRYLRERVGDGRALLAVSGGVDSSVCAVLLKRAIGDRLTCVFIDNGMLRNQEAAQMLTSLREEIGIQPLAIDAGKRFLSRLKGIRDPLQKKRIMRSEFIAILNEVFAGIPGARFIAQGTIYSDLLSSEAEITARSIDSDLLVEPLRMLFKDEVRSLARYLGLPESIIERNSFPSAGLALRCCGEVTAERVDILRRADAVFREEIVAAGQDKRLSRYFTVLTDTDALCRANSSTYAPALVLRAVSGQSPTSFSPARLPNDLLDRVARRIAAEIPEIGRVVYDISGSVGSAIEWE